MKVTFEKISRLLFLPALLIILAFSCEKEDNTLQNTCAVSNPKEELDWLKTKISEFESNNSPDSKKYNFIQQGVYNGETVFIFPNCHPLANSVEFIFNCKGEILFDRGSKPELYAQIKNIQVIWKHRNNACRINP